MAVPAARLTAKDGVVLHLRGGSAAPPFPPPCRGGPPASYTYLRSTGGTNAQRYPDLYYIPPSVAAAVQLAPGFYATPAPGDEFEVIVAANTAGGLTARDRAYRALPPPYDRLEVALAVDGVATQYFSFWTRRAAPADVVYRGWPGADDGGRTVGFRRFRMDRTVGVAVAGDAAAAAAAADASPDLGRLSVTWRPCRRRGVTASPQPGRAPAAAPTLTEREAVKNRSLAAGAGASVQVPRAANFSVDRGRPLAAEEVTIYYRERRVLVARHVLREDGEVTPRYREAAAAASAGGSVGGGGGGGGGAAYGFLAGLPVVAAGGSPAGVAEAGKGKGPRLGGGDDGSHAWVVKPEGGLAAAAAGAAGAPTLKPVKAEAGGAGAGTAATGRGSGGGSRKRKAEVEVIILD